MENFDQWSELKDFLNEIIDANKRWNEEQESIFENKMKSNTLLKKIDRDIGRFG